MSDFIKEGKSGGFRTVFMREWKRIADSRVCLWGIFGIMFISTFILLYMMNTGLPTQIPIAVVDMDNSLTSRELIRQLDGFPKTDVSMKTFTFTEARVAMERNEVYAILTIPENFAVDAASGKQPKLVYYTNNAFLINGSLLFQDLKTISVMASASVGIQLVQGKGGSTAQAMSIAQPIAVESHPLNNPWLNYSVYLNNMTLPGIMQLIILMFTVSCFGSEIKSGTGKELLALSGNSSWKMVLGKILPYSIIFIAMALAIMSILYGINGFPLNSGFWSMFLGWIGLIIASQGFALIIFAVFRNYRFSVSIACLIGMLSIPLSGFTFPVSSMSGILQAITNLTPLRHFFLIYTDQALNGLGFAYSAIHYAVLLTFGLLGMLMFKRVRDIVENDVYMP